MKFTNRQLKIINEAKKIKLNEFFCLPEFVHPSHLFLYPENPENAVRFVSRFQIEVSLALRNIYGGIYINTYCFGGDRVASGTRPPFLQVKGGAKFSDHYLSNAIDFVNIDHTPEQIFFDITDPKSEANKRLLSLGCNTIENVLFTPTWTHLAKRNTLENVYPQIIKIIDP